MCTHAQMRVFMYVYDYDTDGTNYETSCIRDAFWCIQYTVTYTNDV
jgi:hypothetical protein